MHGNDQYTKLLIPGRGVNNSTNIIDVCGKTITRAGNTCISTAQSKFSCYGSSIYFDGSGDYLSLAKSTDFAFGSGNFTVDYWFYMVAYTSNYLTDMISCYHSTNLGWGNSINFASGTANIYLFGDNNNNHTFSYSFSANTWYHLAFSRNGNDLRCFVNGIQVGSTATETHEWNIYRDTLRIGASEEYTGGYPFNGYMSQPRISKGIARWTSNFTPPARPYGFAGLYQ